MPVLQVRKLADHSTERRVKRFDPVTGAPILVNPATSDPNDPAKAGEWRHEPWPLAGVEVVGEPPKECRVPTTWVLMGRREGWIELEGEQVVHRPGGPPDEPWRVTHTFVQGDVLVLKCVDGDVRYRITRQPDKYVEGGKDTDEVTEEVYAAGETQVDWFYNLKLES